MRDAVTRFMAKVLKTADGCWRWKGCRNEKGYGHVKDNGKATHAHRVAWRLLRGEIPQGLCVLHRCDVRDCVNPDHLFLGTQLENIADMKAKGRARALRGDAHPCTKVSFAEVRRVVVRLRAGESARELARRYGVTPEAVRGWARGSRGEVAA